METFRSKDGKWVVTVDGERMSLNGKEKKIEDCYKDGGTRRRRMAMSLPRARRGSNITAPPVIT
jgi:hypothetical protein